jgi:hypothetical protein
VVASRRPAILLGALVAASALVRLVLAHRFTTPWITPDEVIYGLLGESLWLDGTLDLRALSAPYYSVLTPALVGAPLALLGPGAGVGGAQALQALAMSLVAIPVYCWAARVAARWAAFAAATLAVLPAGLVYSGFLMTEPLAYTVTTAALYAMARAGARPTVMAYGVVLGAIAAATAVRLQALVLLAALAVALVLDSVAARRRVGLRPLVLGTVGSAVATVTLTWLVSAGRTPGSTTLVGVYARATDGLEPGATLAGAAWTALALLLATLALPVFALLGLTVHALVRGEPDADLRALCAVAAAYVVVLVVQVGAFTALHTDHVVERYLLTAIPTLMVVLAAWLTRGAPHVRAVMIAGVALALAAVAFVPLDELAGPAALPDSPTLAAVGGLLDDHRLIARLALAAVVVAGATPLLVSQGMVVRLVATTLLAVGLASLSAHASWRIATESRAERNRAVGAGSGAWIDELEPRRATFLATADHVWTAAPRTMFWNRTVEEVVALDGAEPPFPPAPRRAVVTTSGRIVVSGTGAPLTGDVIVAPHNLALRGERLDSHPADPAEAPPLTAWRVEGSVVVETATTGIAPNGDLPSTARVMVYGCMDGALEVTLLGKSGAPVGVSVDGSERPPLLTPAGTAETHRIAMPAGGEGTTVCTVDLRPGGLAGSTRIAFVPAP